MKNKMYSEEEMHRLVKEALSKKPELSLKQKINSLQLDENTVFFSEDNKYASVNRNNDYHDKVSALIFLLVVSGYVFNSKYGENASLWVLSEVGK